MSLAIFAWLLTLHPTAAGRTYAAYGGVYVAIAVSWLWLVEDIKPSVYDIAGISVILFGVAIMVLAPR